MKRTLIVCTAFALSLMASAFTFTAEAFKDHFGTLKRTYEAMTDFVATAAMFVLGALMPKLGERNTADRAPSVRLLAAKQFVLRMIKRDQPTATERYRMCPST